MSKFFDEIFENKIFFDKQDLTKTFNEKLKSKEKPKLTVDEVSDSKLEELMDDFRENPERPFTRKEAEIVGAKLKEAKQECRRLLDVVKNRKDLLNKKISNSNDNFTLDISRSTRLKKASTNIFGGIKHEITYDDYMTLLELKKVIESTETLDLLREGIEDGGI